MAFTAVQKVRNVTTQSVTLIDDETIKAFIEEHTDDDDVWSFELTVAAVFDYLASSVGPDGLGEVTRFTRGPVTVEMSSTYGSRADLWRQKAAEAAGIVFSDLTRLDWTPADETEFGPTLPVIP